MYNVKTSVSGTKVVVEIDTSAPAQKAARLSSTGKTRLIASTGGAVAIMVNGCEGLKLSLNATIPVE